jgi:hypothetical protein
MARTPKKPVNAKRDKLLQTVQSLLKRANGNPHSISRGKRNNLVRQAGKLGIKPKVQELLQVAA